MNYLQYLVTSKSQQYVLSILFTAFYKKNLTIISTPAVGGGAESTPPDPWRRQSGYPIRKSIRIIKAHTLN